MFLNFWWSRTSVNSSQVGNTLGRKWTFCRHGSVWKHKTRYPKTLTTQRVVEYWLYCVTNSELQPTAATQHCDRESYCMSLAHEKIRIQNSKYGSYWICITLALSWSQQIGSWILSDLWSLSFTTGGNVDYENSHMWNAYTLWPIKSVPAKLS